MITTFCDNGRAANVSQRRFQKWSKVKLLMFNAAQHAMQLLALGGQGMEILGIKNCMQKRNL